MKSKLLKINRNEQSTDSKNMKAGQGGFRVSAKMIRNLSLVLGLIVAISWYLGIPARMQFDTEWISGQFNIVLASVLVAMGVFLVIVTGWAFSTKREGRILRKKLEDEIGQRKKVERELSRVQEISKTGNWALELSDKEMRWSNEVYRILDCSPDKVSSHFEEFLKIIHPDDRDFVNNEIQKAINQGAAFNLTHRIVRQDDSIRMVKQRTEIYLDQKGKPAQILGTLQDITDQREVENLAARLSRIIDKSYNEIYVFDSETLKFTKANLAARLNLRYSTEELCEMTPVDLMPEYTHGQFEEMITSLKRGIEAVTIFETVHKRKNGSLYPVDVRLQLSKTGACSQFVAIIQDITDRKKVESLSSRSHQDLDKKIYERTSDLTKLNKDLQKEMDTQKKVIKVLKTSEHRLAGIMDNVADGIITIDEEGTIHSFNRAAENLFDLKIEEALGKNINILMAGSEDTQNEDYFKNLLQSRKSAALGLRRVVTARKKGGASFSAELAVKETVIGDQRMFTGLIRNLTEKEQIDRELMQIPNPSTKF